MKKGEKRYESTDTLFVELQPMFSYHELDRLKKTNPMKILDKRDRDEIFQIYEKNYKFAIETDKRFKYGDNLGDFYLWMVENKCYLMDTLVDKFDRLYQKKINPFRKGIYTLDAMTYLYNRGYIRVYDRSLKIIRDEEHYIATLPKNGYRIRR